MRARDGSGPARRAPCTLVAACFVTTLFACQYQDRTVHSTSKSHPPAVALPEEGGADDAQPTGGVRGTDARAADAVATGSGGSAGIKSDSSAPMNATSGSPRVYVDAS